MNSGVERGGIPVEVSTPSSREESRASDTPLQSENERGATANEAAENKSVTISQEEYTRFLQFMNSSTVDGRNSKNTPNVLPLADVPQKQDIQEKPATLGEEKSASRTELMELRALVTRLSDKVDQTPEREAPLFQGVTPKRLEEQENKLTSGWVHLRL